jgi:hypothetical protein
MRIPEEASEKNRTREEPAEEPVLEEVSGAD